MRLAAGLIPYSLGELTRYNDPSWISGKNMERGRDGKGRKEKDGEEKERV